MRCSDCRFADFTHDPIHGRCRRHAPASVRWPAVYHDDWCGEFEPREAQVRFVPPAERASV